MPVPNIQGYDSSYDFSVAWSGGRQTLQSPYLVTTKDITLTYPALYGNVWTATATTHAHTGPLTYASPTGDFTVTSGRVYTSATDGPTAVVTVTGAYGTHPHTLVSLLNTSGAQAIAGTFASGSFAAVARASVLSVYSGASPTDSSLQRFLSPTYGPTAATTTLPSNPNFVGNGLDISWLSVSHVDNSGSASAGYPAALIASRFALYAWHVGISPGFSYMWRTVHGTIVQATVLSVANLGPIGGSASDVALAYLSAPVTGMSYVQFLQQEPHYLPGLSTGAYNTVADPYGIPAFVSLINAPPSGPTGVSYGQKLLPVQILNSTFNTGSGNIETLAVPCTEAALAPFSTYAISGDSSSAVFYAVPQSYGTVCAIAGMVHTSTLSASGFSFPDAPAYAAEINLAMNTIAAAAGDPTVYAVQQLQMTGFNYY